MVMPCYGKVSVFFGGNPQNQLACHETIIMPSDENRVSNSPRFTAVYNSNLFEIQLFNAVLFWKSHRSFTRQLQKKMYDSSNFRMYSSYIPTPYLIPKGVPLFIHLLDAHPNVWGGYVLTQAWKNYEVWKLSPSSCSLHSFHSLLVADFPGGHGMLDMSVSCQPVESEVTIWVDKQTMEKRRH